MKILHIISSLKIGGAERALCNLLKALSNKSMQHHVAYFHPGPMLYEIKALGIPTHQINGIVYRYDPYAYWTLSRLIKQIKPDVIHSSLWAANIMARLLGYQHGIPVVSALHGNCQHEGALRNMLDRRTAHLSSATVAVAHSVATSYQQHIIGAIKSPARREQAQQRLVTIPNGIDATALVTSAATHPLTRAELGISPEAFVVGAVGRLEPIKSYDVLVRAFARLRSGGTTARQARLHTLASTGQRPVTLLIVGGGSQLAALQQLAAALGIAQQVVFTGARTDAYRFYPLFDCFALSSQSEGLSIALLEALSFGLPIVTTNATQAHEVLTHDTNGFIVPNNNPEALGNALHELYTNPSRTQAMGIANRLLVQQSFGLQNTAKQYDHLFKTLTKSTN